MAYQARFQTLPDIYDYALAKFADRPLFGTKKDGQWEWMTYRDFGKAVDAFRGGLASLGVKRGDLVAMIANNRPEWAIAAFATYGLGASFVPMYESQSFKDWEFIARDCEAKVLICATDEITDKVSALLGQIPTLGHLVTLSDSTNGKKSDSRIRSYRSLLTSGTNVPAVRPAKEDVAQLIYTSGTTGNPKGVILTQFNFASNVSAMNDVFTMDPEDRSLSFLPWAHSFGQTCELYNLISGGAAMAIAESVEKILDNLAEVQPTLLYSVPRIFNKLYTAVQKQILSKPKPIQNMVKAALVATAKERQGERLTLGEHCLILATDKLVFSKVRARFGGRLKYAFSGGAAISREVAEFIDSLGVTIYEGYGLTETSPVATANWPGERRIGSVGRALPGIRIEIDRSQSEAKANAEPGREEGEIVIYGPNVMKGYHNRAEENAAVFTADKGFRTGDMGYLDASGYLYITGRIKEQYKLENGKYVVPTPLEEALKLSPYIANAMVYGDNRPFNVALVVPNMDSLKTWAKQNGLAALDVNQLLKNETVRKFLATEIASASHAFKGFESIKDFALIGEDFTTDNGMLTPSLKLKRKKVLDRYGAELGGLYGKPKASAAASAA